MSDSELYDAVFEWLDTNGVSRGGAQEAARLMIKAGIIKNSAEHKELIEKAVMAWDGWNDEYDCFI